MRAASYFSYIAFTDLAQNRDKLAANGVEIEYVNYSLSPASCHVNKRNWHIRSNTYILSIRIHPVLLGGINHLSGTPFSHIHSPLLSCTHFIMSSC
jgi:hypothetical protein